MKLLIFSICLLFIVGCAPSRFVEPLDKGTWSVGGNLGGPVIDFGGAPIPVPLTEIEAGYGLDSNLTVHGGLHTTALLFGVGQFDFGATYKLLDQKKYFPNLSVALGGNVAYSPSEKAAEFWPTLDVNAYWNYGARKSYFYVGFNNYFVLQSRMAFDQQQEQRIIFNPQIGHVFKPKSGGYQIFAELKFIAPHLDSEKAFVPYKSMFGTNGATGFYIGFRKLLGTKN